MRILLAVSLSLLLLEPVCVRCAEENLSKIAHDFLKDHSSEDDDKKWAKKMLSRLDDMIKDNDAISSQNAAADIVVYDWFADRVGKFEKDQPLSSEEKVEICRFFTLYEDNHWNWPHKLAKEITFENYKKWIADAPGIASTEKQP